MSRHVTAYIVDNYEFKLYQSDVNLTIGGIKEHIDFNAMGSQIRLINGKPYKILCESVMKPGYIYYPSTLLEGDTPDILGSIIITGVDQFGDSISLTQEDIDTIDEFTTLRYYQRDNSLEICYCVEVENPSKVNKQYNDRRQIKHLSRVL